MNIKFAPSVFASKYLSYDRRKEYDMGCVDNTRNHSIRINKAIKMLPQEVKNYLQNIDPNDLSWGTQFFLGVWNMWLTKEDLRRYQNYPNLWKRDIVRRFVECMDILQNPCGSSAVCDNELTDWDCDKFGKPKKRQ